MKTKTTPESSKHRGATAGGHSTPGLAGTLAPEIRPEQSIELLKALHILTREGKLNQDSRRKLKQVYHLYQFIEKLLLELPATGHGITLADHGASCTTCSSRSIPAHARRTFMALKPGPNW